MRASHTDTPGFSWQLRRPVPPGTAPWTRLARERGLEEGTARLAWMRRQERPEDLDWRLDPSWERGADPFLLEGMGLAVHRIRQAVAEGQPITVYGDYDVDGVTATALLVRVLERLGATVDFFIPNRFSDGYGLQWDCIRELVERRGPGLAISVDCGVRSLEEVIASRELGLDWVITDHHALGETLPAAHAVIHPALGDYPNPNLAGVGVAFKLAQALLDAAPYPRGELVAFLDGLVKLVALGTLADMVPLVGENALLTRRGLLALGGGNAPGISALLRLAGVVGTPTSQALIFNVVPRLNAVGRMGGAEDAVRLLLSKDAVEAEALAQRVETLNRQRRLVQAELSSILPPPSEVFDFVITPGAHQGVLGILAGQRSRLTGRPSAVCAQTDGLVRCSLRAPEGYDLSQILDLARPFLLGGGGHKSAAGMSFDPRMEPMIRRTMEKAALEQASGVEAAVIALDGHGAASVPSADGLSKLEPFGQGFPPPVVALEGLLSAEPRKFGDGHLKLRLQGMAEDIVCFKESTSASALLAQGETLCLAASPMDHPRFGRSWRLESPLAQEALAEGLP